MTIGTIILSVVRNLPGNTPLKSLLITASPTITIFSTWLVEIVMIYLKERRVKKFEARFMKRVERAFQNPYLSLEDKQKVQDMVKQLEMDNIESLAAKIKDTISEINNL